MNKVSPASNWTDTFPTWQALAPEAPAVSPADLVDIYNWQRVATQHAIDTVAALSPLVAGPDAGGLSPLDPLFPTDEVGALSGTLYM